MRDPVSDTLKACPMSAWFLVLTSSPRDIEWLTRIRTAAARRASRSNAGILCRVRNRSFCSAPTGRPVACHRPARVARRAGAGDDSGQALDLSDPARLSLCDERRRQRSGARVALGAVGKQPGGPSDARACRRRAAPPADTLDDKCGRAGLAILLNYPASPGSGRSDPVCRPRCSPPRASPYRAGPRMGLLENAGISNKTRTR